MSTIAAQAIDRAITRGITNIDRYGHEIEAGYLIQAPAGAGMEWIAPDAAGIAKVTHMLGDLQRPRDVLTVEWMDQHTLAAEHCQRVSTEREAQHLSRLRGAAQFYNVKRGKMVPVAETKWLVRTPATAIAQALLGESRWTYLTDPVGAHRPGETHQEGTAHAYHSREAAERAIKAAQQRGREHAQHAEAIEVSA